MLNHTLQPLEVLAWPDDLRQALERGLFCPLRTSRRSTSPTSGGSERHRTRGTRMRCWKRCPIWRHRPPPRTGTSQCVLAPLGDEEAPRGATDVWGDLEEALQRRNRQGRGPAIQSPEELLALERRTHPLTCERDHIDPIIYSALEIRAQVNRGERPAPEQVVGMFWTRQSRTWDLPSLTGVYAHRFTFKYIYSAWTAFPLVVKTQRRGRNRLRISGWGTSCRCGRRRSPSWRAWESPSRAVRRNGATSLRRWGRFWQPRTSSSIAHCR